MSKFTKSRFAKVTAGVVGLTAGVFMMFGFVGMSHAAGLTQAQIDAVIGLLESFGADSSVVNNVRTSLTGGAPSSGGTTTTGGGACTWTRSLHDGVSGADVTCLQDYLTGTGHFTFSGGSTGYFGPVTTAAVAAWQAANGVSPAVGWFGPISQAKYAEVAGGTSGGGDTGGTTPPVVTPGTGLTVSAGTQPAASLAPDSAARVPFTRFMLTAGSDGDVTVNSVVVERVGLASDTSFSGIVLIDETTGAQIGIARTLNSNHQVTLGTSFVVPAGTTRSYLVAANMAADNSTRAGEVPAFSVVAVNSSATVSGALPITGAGHTINATLTVGQFTSPSNGTLVSSADASLDVGTVNKVFTSVKWTASNEDMYFKSIRWNQVGSASEVTDLANVVTIVDGVSYPTTLSGDYYTTTFPGQGILVTKGNSKEVSVRGDVINGSTRTIKFEIQKSSDVYTVGKTYGYGSLPAYAADSGGTDGNFDDTDDPYYDAYSHTISAGTMTVSGWTQGVPSQNVAYNLAGEPLGGFTVDVRGEPITVQTMKFGVGITTGSSEIADITGITVVDQNGNVLASATDGTDTDQYQLISFSDSVTFPVGITRIKLLAKYGTDFSNNDVVQASTTVTGWTTVKGDTTGVSITPTPSTAVSGQNMTVKTGSLAISVSSQPTSRNIIAGTEGFEFARYTFDATSSGEDVRMSTFIAEHTFSGDVADTTGCYLYDGSTQITEVLQPSVASGSTETFTFTSGGLVVPKGTAKTVSLKCDLSTSASADETHQWGVEDSASSYTAAVGATSGQTITETWTAATGQTMTVAASGSYTVTADTSILYKMAQAGSTDVTLAAFRFTAGAEEDVMIKRVALELGNTASNTPTDLLNEEVTLWHDGVKVGTAKFVGASADNATSTLTSAVTVPAGESVLITVKGSLSSQGVNSAAASFGAFLSVTYDGDNVGLNGNYGTGASSGSTISSGTTSDVTTNGLRVFRTVPSIAVTSTGGTLAPGGDLYKFTVTNPNNRGVVFQKFTFTVATTGGAVRDFVLYGDGVAFNSSVSTLAATTLELTGTQTSQAQLVPANSSKTYVLKAATVDDTASVAETINLTLLADTAYPDAITTTVHMDNVTNIEAGTEATANNIIWSPFSTTTPVVTAAVENNQDWTNGYGMPGFPSNGNFPTQSWTRAN